MTDWKALAGRITLFPGSPAPLLSASELYKQAWGINPENFLTGANALAPTIAQGKRAGIALNCSVHPTRIDFNFLPPPSATADMSLRLIEDTSQLRAELAQLIDFISGHDISNSVSRVGVYFHFVALAPNIEEANKMLMAVLPNQYRIGITNEEDFIFQINTPRMSSDVTNVKMNYVMKWNLDRFQVLNISIPMSGGAAMSPPRPQEFIAASVTFDYNNVPVSSPLTREQQSSLLSEFLKASEEIQKAIGLNIEGF